jgi:hypothetical protein
VRSSVRIPYCDSASVALPHVVKEPMWAIQLSGPRQSAWFHICWLRAWTRRHGDIGTRRGSINSAVGGEGTWYGTRGMALWEQALLEVGRVQFRVVSRHRKVHFRKLPLPFGGMYPTGGGTCARGGLP